jgi:diamine N-acetyltransferase
MTIASGPRIALRRSTPLDAARAFDWLACSDLTGQWLGAPWFPERPVPAQSQFRESFGPHYFDGSRVFDGRAVVLRAAALDLGILVWHRIDLMRDVVELDLWLRGSAFARQGIGSEALELACAWLQAHLGVNRFLLRPSRRNVRALRCARRAGFRETDLEPVDVGGRLGLAASPYRDAVLMFRILPTPRAMPDCTDSVLWVFIDSEFTSLESPQLISFGAVCLDGRTFYAEVEPDGGAAPSAFVVDQVLPLLEGCAEPRDRVASRLVQWLQDCANGRAVILVSDSGYDRWAAGALLQNEELPPWAQWMRVPVAYSELDHLALEQRLRRHHALDDALALRLAVVGDSPPKV